VDLFTLTRQLVDIESITGTKPRWASFLQRQLSDLGYTAKKIPVEGDRFNVFATLPREPAPAVVFSTHMDVVPAVHPFL